MQALYEATRSCVRDARAHLMSLETALVDHYGPERLQTPLDDQAHVANVSAREARLWVQLNGTELHQRIRNAKGSEERLLEIMGKPPFHLVFHPPIHLTIHLILHSIPNPIPNPILSHVPSSIPKPILTSLWYSQRSQSSHRH